MVLHPTTFLPEQFSLYSSHLIINIIFKQVCYCFYSDVSISSSSSELGWLKRCINKTPTFREKFCFLIICQRKHKVKEINYYWVQHIKIISEKVTAHIELETVVFLYDRLLPASQKCKEAFHILFRSDNYNKYTGGFYTCEAS